MHRVILLSEKTQQEKRKGLGEAERNPCPTSLFKRANLRVGRRQKVLLALWLKAPVSSEETEKRLYVYPQSHSLAGAGSQSRSLREPGRRGGIPVPAQGLCRGYLGALTWRFV